MAEASDGSSVEVGVRFNSDVNGFVTGLRFYKGAGNTGTHIANLWTDTGTLLGQATFEGESDSGWQQVDFDRVIPITAHQNYIASYFAPTGHYALDSSYFALAGRDSAPLHAPQDGVAGGNGLFSYSPTSLFPTSTFGSNNYWVDVAFDTTFTPVVNSVSPVDGNQYVSPDSNLKMTFNGPLDPSSVNPGTIFLKRTSTGALVPASVTFNAATQTVTLDPGSDLLLNKGYTIVVKGGAGGVHAVGGGTMGADFTSSFHTVITPSLNLWGPSAVPAVAANPDDALPVEVGVRFLSESDGFITGLRFYKGTGNDGTHTGHLWTADGTLLATAVFTDESATGWQQINFPSPVAVSADTTYVASYFAPLGHYALNTGYFATQGQDSPPLHAPQDGAGGGNGLFIYGGSAFPTNTFSSNNYWVDIVFAPFVQQQPNTPPTAQNQTVSVTEDAQSTVLLAGTDQETAPQELLYRIESLPTRGLLKRNGVPVQVGQTFTGSPTNLTYIPGAETEGNTSDSFTFSVVDEDALTSNVATVSINVTKAVADGTAVRGSDGILRIGGTSGIDVITISRTSTGMFRVLNGLRVISDNIPVASVSEIRVWGREGVDGIALIDVATKSMLSGGAGTDVIVGGSGDDLIIGGAGDDVLTGMSGNDVIIGGIGRDALLGMDGNDVLAAGSLASPISLDDLRALGAEWAASQSTTPAEAAAAEQVVTDSDQDLLTGGNGSDWFIMSLSDRALDVTNRVGNRDVITYVV